MSMVLNMLNRQFSSMASLLVLYVPYKRSWNAVNRLDVLKISRSVNVVILVIVNLEMDPELFGDPGDIFCILSMNFRSHFNDVAVFIANYVFFQYAEFVII